MPGQGDEVAEGGVVGRLLRSSVTGFVAAVGIAGLVLLVRALTSGDASIATWVLVAMLGVLGLSGGILVSERPLTMGQLRAIKDACFLGVALYLVASGYVAMAGHLRNGDAVAVPATLHLLLLQNGLLITVYGILIPNAFRRAVWAIVGLAMLPLVAPLALWADPSLTAELAGVITPALAFDSAVWIVVGIGVATLVAFASSRYFDTLYEARLARRYKLHVQIGAGGMGEVWRAEHNMLARTAAIKLILPDHRDGAAAERILRRFEVEARATAALRSPHTIEVYDFGTTEEGTFYYAMEYLEGLDMSTLVAHHGPLPAGRVIHLLLQACQSLGEAHGRGLVHRDIKPANLYVCQLGGAHDFVKVLDFGLVKGGEFADGEAEHSLSGTPAYMAPEMAVDPSAIDGRADLYALGCVAYYLLTGHYVFEAKTPVAMITDHINTAPIPPSRKTELAIPEDLEHLVIRCLAKAPADRWRTAGELAEALRACAAHGTWDAEDAGRWWATH